MEVVKHLMNSLKENLNGQLKSRALKNKLKDQTNRIKDSCFIFKIKVLELLKSL